MTDHPTPMPEKISRYETRGEIGRGGMATVYLAYDPNFGREVAIKVLPHELMHDPTFRVRFHREARTIAALEHPAIVPVYDFGEDNGQPFLVMRHLSGGSLVARIRAGPVPPAEAARILLRIGSALDAAHAKGVVHRDLKPANILFDQYGDAYLGDFGIAQLSGSGGTLTGQMVLGTPAYMSPEQIRGDKKVDGRSDIYALGIVMFEMLTGKAPFEADSPVKMMMMHLSTPPPRVPETAARLPPGSSEVIERALAKEPEQRYQKAADFGKAFQDLTTGERRALMGVPPGMVDHAAGTLETPPEPQKVRPFVPGYTGELGQKTSRWPWIAAIGAAVLLAACICLAAGGGGTLLAFSDLDQWLFGVPTQPAATLTATATKAQTQTGAPSETAAPSAEPGTPAPAAAAYVPGEPFRLTNGRQVSSKPRIAVDSKGITHVFWMDKTDALQGKIFHRLLSAGGAWSEPDCVTCLAGDPGYVYDYQLAARGNGEVCVGYMHAPKFKYIISAACYNGGGPARTEEIPVPESDTGYLLDMDPAGSLVPVFLTNKTIRIGENLLTDNSIHMFANAFGIDSQGGYHLAWVRDTDPPVMIYRYSSDKGAAWSAAEVVLEDANISDDVMFFPGRAGEMYLLVKGIDTRILRWKGSWAKPQLLEDNYVPYHYAFVRPPDSGPVLLSLGWYDDREGIWLFREDAEAGAWSGPQFLARVDKLSMIGFSATAGPDGRLLLAYGDSVGDILIGEIYFLAVEPPS